MLARRELMFGQFQRKVYNAGQICRVLLEIEAYPVPIDPPKAII